MTRADLSPGNQATQCSHAALAFSVTFPELTRDWHDASNNLILLSVPDEATLDQLTDLACAKRIPCVQFHEPDFGDALTAVAFAPSEAARKLLANLPLALPEAAMV